MLYVLCKTEQKATDLIKYKHKTFVHYFCIYRELQENDISVIENKAFNNLPSLQSLWVSFSMKYDPNMPIHVIGQGFYIKQVAEKCAFRTLQILDKELQHMTFVDYL